ncbi:MAG: FKBP-type peptidyl-prolyl cis-trans isomerase [Bacteroidales bacterium]|jgi:FKBP-type peptidyl-prolyl cis-trans isomerase|nr:FKBP-type peptidyl-prolyl cis-trans isomerase [Bacteroidales bacterium]
MKTDKFLLALVGCLFFISCDKGYKGFEKAESGLYYKFYLENTTKHVPDYDEIISIFMTIQTENDSFVQEPKHITIVMQKPKFKGDIFDALALMHEGDSATFIINAKQYYDKYNYSQIPSFVKDDKTMLWFTIKVDSILSFEQYQTIINNIRQENELKDMLSYMQQNNISASSSTSGLFYSETKAGTGNSPKPGQFCTVNYTGTLLDGTLFDSSIGREPFSFQLGAGQVIQGWEEGVAMMKKNGKATLIIPSHLAYGERSMGNIPAYSPLVFEVELIDIK